MTSSAPGKRARSAGHRVARAKTPVEVKDLDLEQLNQALAGSLCERMGMKFESVTPETGIASMPVLGNTQPAGILHGGASITLAESLASVCALAHAKTVLGDGAQAVGVSVSATHHRPIKSGQIQATCSAQHLGSQIQTYLVEVKDRRKHLLCTVTITTMILPPRVPSKSKAKK